MPKSCKRCEWSNASYYGIHRGFGCLHPDDEVSKEFYQSTPPNHSRSPMREFCEGYTSLEMTEAEEEAVYEAARAKNKPGDSSTPF